MILVPVKNLADAKQRLSSVLSPEERFALAQAMCEDVLRALATCPNRPPVAVVTSDPFAMDLAKRFNFDIIGDDNSGETNAIEMATAACKARGAQSTLVIPADIPLIDISELQQIIDCAPPPRDRTSHKGGTVLVPDAAGRGTNAAWRSPADLFPLRFGNDSFLPHLAAAKATGSPCVVLELPGIARDVDRPEDLHELVSAHGDRRSQKLVRSWNLGKAVDSYQGMPSGAPPKAKVRMRL
jgi:2-phospho-L-lactate/phosphoenolpyruvate guanylyltransferase